MISREEIFGYSPEGAYGLSVAYFSMEFAIHQALKIYSGGLGFLSGSHLRSAFELKQNLVGVGILWKYGYYDQVRAGNGGMKVDFIEKDYSFLTDTGLVFTIDVHDSPVHVKAWLLHPDTFGTAPLFLLSTDIPENDGLSRSITHRLYDPNEATRIAQSIILGIGGARLLDELQLTPEVYHMNEGHGVALNFYLYAKHKSLEEVRKRVVFTTHTPEMAGNESHRISLLKEMSFFYHLQEHEVKSILQLDGEEFNYTLAALKFSRKANGVSSMHGEVSRRMWGGYPDVCNITSITNAQSKAYWADPIMDEAIRTANHDGIIHRKKELKRALFSIIADQCGKLFDENVLTIVWARRFAGYKRADMLLYDGPRFEQLMGNKNLPVQLIWAGKPYPEDTAGTDLFNRLVSVATPFANCAVLTGYELGLSAALKRGADVWLNNPRLYHEASGTSGMTAAMNGAVNLSIPDGWVPEFAKDGENCFLIQPADLNQEESERDRKESINLLKTLENTVLPMYYHDQDRWLNIVRQGAADVVPAFESGRMAREYYEVMYHNDGPAIG